MGHIIPYRMSFKNEPLRWWREIQNLLCLDQETELPFCGLDKTSSVECDWEGTQDDSIYTGVLDQLPPYSRNARGDVPYHNR